MFEVLYNPADWYWRVVDLGRLYSSRLRGYVSAESTEFLHFQSKGGIPTPIANFEELKSVLATQYPEGLPVELTSYASTKRWQLEQSGITVNGIRIDTNRESQALINGAFTLAQTDAQASFQFKSDGQFISLSADEMRFIGQAVAKHVQACFVWEAETLDAIQAGIIISEAEIDARAEGLKVA